MEERIKIDKMKFNKDKCKVLLLRKEKSNAQILNGKQLV